MAARYSNTDFGMEDLLSTFFGSTGKFPPVDVIELDDSYRIDAEVAGFDPKDIEITVERHMLTISGKMPEEKKDEERRYFIRERQNSSMKRSFQLPEDADEESISADFRNGVLSISVKKEPKSLPKKISVRIGSDRKEPEAIETTAEEAENN